MGWDMFLSGWGMRTLGKGNILQEGGHDEERSCGCIIWRAMEIW